MASIQKVGKRYRVQISRNGRRESRVFDLKTAAAMWALEREAEMTGAKLPDRTFADAMCKYQDEVVPLHRGAKWETTRLRSTGKHPIAKKRLTALSAADFSEWRDDRLKTVSPATVLREINLINSVLESCRRDWKWLHENPLKDMRKPKAPPSRKRRVTQSEIDALVDLSGLHGTPDDLTQLSAHAFLFALETAMRSGEILAMQWQDIGDYSVNLPRTKNGDQREVPLSPAALALLAQLPRKQRPYPIRGPSRDTLFRKLVKRSGIRNLHFHDARSEAIFRLSKKLDILELARMVGHRDLKSLMLYYRATAEELAAKLR